MKKINAIALVLLLGITNLTFAVSVTIWQDNFDYPTGQTLADNGWILSYGNPPGASTYDPDTDKYWEIRLDNRWYDDVGTIPYVSPFQSAWLVQGQGYSNIMMEAKHSFTSQTKGKITLDMRASTIQNDVAPARFYILSPSGEVVAFVNFAAQYGVMLNDRVSFGSFNPRQWYHIELSWDVSTKKVSLNVHGLNVGTKTDDFVDINAASVGQIKLLNNSAASTNGPSAAWFDNIIVKGEQGRNCISYSTCDLNYDCVVDLKDFGVLASEWMKCSDQAVIGCIWP